MLPRVGWGRLDYRHAGRSSGVGLFVAGLAAGIRNAELVSWAASHAGLWRGHPSVAWPRSALPRGAFFAAGTDHLGSLIATVDHRHYLPRPRLTTGAFRLPARHRGDLIAPFHMA